MDKEKVYKLIKDYDIGMMTNVNESGKLVSHPMTRQGDIEDDVLWFFSERDSEKTTELKKNNSVNISFSGDDYISVSGTVEIVDDVETKKDLWSKANKTFFDGGPEDDQVILLKVNIDSVEYWTSDNILKNAFEFAKGMATDKDPDLGENDALEI